MFSVLSHPAPGTSSLTIDVHEERDHHRPRIDLTGALVGPHSRRLHQAVIDLLRSEVPRAMELNLAGLTDLDAAGLRALETCLEDARQVDCRITVRNFAPVPAHGQGKSLRPARGPSTGPAIPVGAGRP
jgi:anti-anti-sigma regulatory factor